MPGAAIDPSWDAKTIDRFGGAFTFRDSPDVPVGKSLSAVNCEFRPRMVRKRYGFGEAFDANEAITGFYNWISNLGNYLVWFNAGVGVKIIDVTANPPTESTIIATASGHSATFTDMGDRLIVCIFGTNQRGATQGYVISYQSAAFVADKLFSPALTYAPSTATEPGAGVITQGNHYLAYAVEHRGGFIGALSPNSAGTGIATFAPVLFTAAGSANATWTLNTTWPTDAVKVHVAMSPVSEPDNFIFVPGANAAVTGGALESKAITFDATDEFLLSLGPTYSAVDHRLFLTQVSAGTGPFNPSSAVLLGDRVGYITTSDDNVGNAVSALRISARQKFQQVEPDLGTIQLPGQREIITAREKNGAVHIFGPNWTYVTSDNNLYPKQWPTPQLVDGQKGTPSIRGVAESADGSFFWVVTKAGLYRYDGRYDSLPISYEQTDVWRTINWNYGHMVQVAELAEKKVIAVLVPLGSATSPSHILVWNYRNGIGPIKSDYSSWTFGAYSLGAIGIVQNELNGVAAANYKKLEFWLASSGADAILRQMADADSSPYRDDAAAIAFQYDTALVPPKKPMHDLQHHGAEFRLRGAGFADILCREMDIDDDSFGLAQEEDMGSIKLTAAPAQEEPLSADMIAQAKYYRVSEAALDGWIELTGITDYSSFYSST